jgi:hypothetical protein
METTEESTAVPRGCDWTLHKDTTWRTECKEELLNEWTSFEFKFCPFCGRVIEKQGELP